MPPAVPLVDEYALARYQPSRIARIAGALTVANRRLAVTDLLLVVE